MTIVFFYIRKDSTNFQKILLFKVPAIFWKWKLCCACDARARGEIHRIFGIDLLNNKHIPGQKKHVAFRKSLNPSTLLYSMLSIKIRKVQIFSNIFHTYNEYEVLYSILLQSNQQDLKNQIFIVVREITRSWAHATTVAPIWQCFKANCRLTGWHITATNSVKTLFWSNHKKKKKWVTMGIKESVMLSWF